MGIRILRMISPKNLQSMMMRRKMKDTLARSAGMAIVAVWFGLVKYFTINL